MAVRGKTTEQRDAEFIKRTAPLREVPISEQGALADKLRKKATKKAANWTGVVKAVLHQLERGPASEGDLDDIRWCAMQLRDVLEEAGGELIWKQMRKAEAEQLAKRTCSECIGRGRIDYGRKPCGTCDGSGVVAVEA